uniref:Putative secreted protein n=1 Tax=Amblyomma triste TaxID=251400 RepID=A0A023G3V8_AMBTT
MLHCSTLSYLSIVQAFIVCQQELALSFVAIAYLFYQHCQSTFTVVFHFVLSEYRQICLKHIYRVALMTSDCYRIRSHLSQLSRQLSSRSSDQA